jgi:hypothetical protein
VKKQKPLSWKAVHRGEIYCAPACGGGCTYAAFLKANADAARLCETLDRTTGSNGWTPRVSENIGWHYSAISPCGRLKVHPETCPPESGPRYYSAFLGAAGECGGTWSESGKTPAKAVQAVIAVGRKALAGYGALLSGLEELPPALLTKRIGRRPLALKA